MRARVNTTIAVTGTTILQPFFAARLELLKTCRPSRSVAWRYVIQTRSKRAFASAQKIRYHVRGLFCVTTTLRLPSFSADLVWFPGVEITVATSPRRMKLEPPDLGRHCQAVWEVVLFFDIVSAIHRTTALLFPNLRCPPQKSTPASRHRLISPTHPVCSTNSAIPRTPFTINFSTLSIAGPVVCFYFHISCSGDYFETSAISSAVSFINVHVHSQKL